MRVRLLKSTGVLVLGGNVRIACRRGQALGQLGPGVLDGAAGDLWSDQSLDDVQQMVVA